MIEIIYVKLLSEDVDVWRPIKASKLSAENEYLILDHSQNQIPPGEIWEFIPGVKVRTKNRNSDGQNIKVAFELIE